MANSMQTFLTHQGLIVAGVLYLCMCQWRDSTPTNPTCSTCTKSPTTTRYSRPVRASHQERAQTKDHHKLTGANRKQPQNGGRQRADLHLLHLDQHQFIKIHSFLILFSRFWRLYLSRFFLFTKMNSTCFNKLLKKIHTRKCFTKLKKKIQTRFPCGKARIL